jgi:hypothetical protein
MKIKHIANFTDGTDWAKAATYVALNLSELGHDVYCEDFKYNNNYHLFEHKIEELLNKKNERFDYCIQQVLPTDYKKFYGVKNIGLLGIDTRSMTSIPWIKNIKLMDHMLVPDRYSKTTLNNLNINSDIFHFSFNKEYLKNTVDRISMPTIENEFNFIIAGEYGKIKNLEASLIAFHTEFNKKEPANLLIGFNTEPTFSLNLINEINKKLKLGNNLKKEIVFSCLDIGAKSYLFKNSNAYIAADYGSPWDYHAAEVMSLGCPVIYNDGLGIEEFCQNTGYKVKSRIAPCYDVLDNPSYLFSSKDFWSEIDILDLRSKMRNVYDLWLHSNDKYRQLRISCENEISNFDYRNNNIARTLL